jgi:ABC-type transporter Mla subunit MlaD
MARDRDRDVPWGGFILLAAILTLAGVIFFAADLRRRVEGTHVVVAAFPEGGAIRRGAPVWIAGRESGRVIRVEMLPPDDSTTGGIVVLAEFPASARDILGADSRVRVAAGSPTSGEIVEFLPGRGAPLTPSDTVWGVQPVDRAALLVNGLGLLAGRMKAMFDTVQAVADAGEVRVERLDDLGEEAVRVVDLLDAFSASAGRTAAARGDLLGDVNRLTDVMARLGGLLARARAAVIGPDATRGEATALRERLPATVGSLRDQLAALQAALDDPNGSLSRLQTDSALWRAIGSARAEADSLFAELSANPGRMF